MKSFVMLAFALTAAPSAGAQQQPTPAVTPLGATSALLSLSAEAQVRRTPDLALFSAGVATQGRTAAEALAENSRRMDAVVSALRRSGIAARDVQTSAISLQPRYSNPDLEAQIRAWQAREPYVPPAQPEAPRIIGYEARNNVQVRARRLGEMGRLIDTLISAGANRVDGSLLHAGRLARGAG